MAPSISASATATPMFLQLMVFVILILATALFLGGTAAALAYRNRLLAASAAASRARLSSRVDLEKGPALQIQTQSHNACTDDDTKPSPGLVRRFLRWRQRVLYESDSLPELALLPSYRPKESLWRKVLNLVLRKKHVIPDPPTIVTITRVIEAAEARERAAAAAAAATVVAKADGPPLPLPPPSPSPLPVVRARAHTHNAHPHLPPPPPPSFQIPAIVVQCWDTPALPALPTFPPSRSSASASTATSVSCLTPSSLSPSGEGLALSPAVASPATFFFPSFPRASLSPFDYLHVPPPSWGGPMAEQAQAQAQVLADAVSNVSGARFVLGPAPPPRAVLKYQSQSQSQSQRQSQSKGPRMTGAGVGAMYAPPPPPACMAFAGSAPVKQVDGERKVRRARDVRSAANGGPVPRAPQEGVVGIVALAQAGGGRLALGPPPPRDASGGGSDSSDSDDRPDGLGRRGTRDSEASAPVLDLGEGLLASASTTSSLVDLILEAIAAETDESFHYTTVSTSFSATSSSSSASSSSSSRSSTASTASSHSGASWASDEDEEAGIAIAAKADRDIDGHRSFLMLEDESEEDFMDAVLSAYIRTDDEDSDGDSEVCSSHPSSGSDYGEFDDVDLCDPQLSTPSNLKTAANMNMKSLLPHRRKFLSAVRVVHPGFAI